MSAASATAGAAAKRSEAETVEAPLLVVEPPDEPEA